MLTPYALSELERLIPDLAAVYVFGSRARGDARPDSDLDIAVVTRAPAARDALWSAREALELALNLDVDLVDMSSAPLTLTHQILAEGRRVHAPDPTLADFMEVRLMRDYEDLKRRRAGIERDIRERGTVFAA